MIRIPKRPTSPTVLSTRGTTKAQAHCNEYDSSPDEYRRGTKFFRSSDFDDTIFAAPDVKAALLEDQQFKCAFCESFVQHVSYGTVEHFRPKAGYRQRRGEPLRRPGYYWLAYDWDNLFFCCNLCNEQFKENLFPLRDNRSRARPWKRDISKEKPLLINPATQNPADFIGFRRHVAFPAGGCPEGTTTIEVLGLNRDKLAENRRQRLQDIEALIELCTLLRDAAVSDPGRLPELQSWEAKLRAKKDRDAEYAAMARAFLA
jgi:uncharacterized protein (TIGR02646 family)